MNSKLVLILCFKICLGICPCGYFGPNCRYYYNDNLLKDYDYEYFAYDFPEIKNSENRDCFLNYDGMVECICKEVRTKLKSMFLGFLLNSEYKCVLDRCFNFTCKELGRCILLKEMPVCVCGSIENKDNTTCNQSACISGTFVPQPFCSVHGTCISEKNGHLRCVCESELYSGQYCEKVTNLCESNTCLNGGTCVKNSISDFCCLCPPDYSGNLCEFKMQKIISEELSSRKSSRTSPIQDITSNPDEFFNISSNTELKTELHSFRQTSDYLTSSRPSFFDLITNQNCCGTTFILENSEMFENFCQSNPCKNNASCINLPNSYQCVCAIFFNGINCELEEDDCSEISNPCVNNSTCINYLGTGNYECECEPYFSGKNCQTVRNLCEYQPCLNKGICIFNQTELIYRCICQEGFNGTNCEIKSDPCDQVKCLNGGYCVSYQIPFNGTNHDLNYTLFSQQFQCICTIARTIGIASAISIASFYTFVIVMDLSKFICKTNIFPIFFWTLTFTRKYNLYIEIASVNMWSLVSASILMSLARIVCERSLQSILAKYSYNTTDGIIF
ncbi:neurogenic locus notch -like protein [Brachionus plicatilis]|uniref:Neurogenic locus notch-like protein n=1 Tax=Brachionus plicatilis TaxID=10195 RepID=A0A3M7PQM1_BRAPC|nr:neurogenic locus notch -like protein [Brachionus plicatilis]